MKKVNTKKVDKIWGYELWLYSPLKGFETTLEDGTKPTKGPLVKILKADEPLPVQVHPNDEWAKKLENQENGKTESWYVLEAKDGAKMVIGLKTFNKDEIKKAIKANKFEDLLDLTTVKKGDFINVPAGMVHGVGGGITVFEVQQPSDITYRHYDYNRIVNGKLRELQLEKALECQMDGFSFKLDPISTNPLTYKNTVGTQKFLKGEHFVESPSVIVNLETYETFVSNGKENVNFPFWALVPIE